MQASSWVEQLQLIPKGSMSGYFYSIPISRTLAMSVTDFPNESRLLLDQRGTLTVSWPPIWDIHLTARQFFCYCIDMTWPLETIVNKHSSLRNLFRDLFRDLTPNLLIWLFFLIFGFAYLNFLTEFQYDKEICTSCQEFSVCTVLH